MKKRLRHFDILFACLFLVSYEILYSLKFIFYKKSQKIKIFHYPLKIKLVIGINYSKLVISYKNKVNISINFICGLDLSTSHRQ